MKTIVKKNFFMLDIYLSKDEESFLGRSVTIVGKDWTAAKEVKALILAAKPGQPNYMIWNVGITDGKIVDRAGKLVATWRNEDTEEAFVRSNFSFNSADDSGEDF